MNLDFKDKTVWVTGGSRGIGRATALSFARLGADIAISYRSNDSEAEKLLTELQGHGVRCMATKTDVSKLSEVEAAYDQIKDQLGPATILVNSAGITRDDLFIMIEEDGWSDVLQTNLMGVVHTTKVVTRDMMMNRWGRIINLSSAAGTKGGRGQSNYAASKGAVEALTRSLAVELGPKNITVNCVAPGVIETDMSAEVRKLASDQILDRQIVKSFGQPDEIAAWIAMLASEYGRFITGQTIAVDGGLKMP